jgi:DNA-cytosine methyltransferase
MPCRNTINDSEQLLGDRNPTAYQTLSPITPPDAEQPSNISKVHLRVGELFVGAGAFGLGFILANHPLVQYHPLFAVDCDPAALRSYRRNMEWLSQHATDVLHDVPDIVEADIVTLDMVDLMHQHNLERGELDILIGGSPCQGFSSSNKSQKAQGKKEEMNNLINTFLDRVDDVYPKMFLMENVQGVRWTEPTSAMSIPDHQIERFPDFEMPIENVKQFLEYKARTLGYRIWSGFEDAAEFGVPQHRLRFFLFGIRSDLLEDGQVVSLAPYLSDLRAADKTDVIMAIGDLPPLENGEQWEGTDYHPDPTNMYVALLRRHMNNGDLYDHFATRHKEHVLERFRLIPQGQNWQSIRDQMTTYTQIDNTHLNIYRRLRAEEPANTISHYRKSMVIHPLQHRGLSFREACRLQSCPDWFRFEGTREQQQQQLANIVPPLMASQVAYAVAECWYQLCHEDTP